MSVQAILRRRTVLWGGVAIALVGLIGWGPPVVAQEQQEVAADETVEEEAVEDEVFVGTVTVTDSLIPRADLSALSPVTVLEVEDELRYSGITRIEDLVVSLPQVFSAQNSTIANGASGTATIDLRDLGVARTLVLVNGRRMAGGDGWQGSASYGSDLNAIPSAIVKRVDVLTGGASTTYGADAVAGVVNFVMDTEFEGVRIGFQQSGNQRGVTVILNRIGLNAIGKSRRIGVRLIIANVARSPTEHLQMPDKRPSIAEAWCVFEVGLHQEDGLT